VELPLFVYASGWGGVLFALLTVSVDELRWSGSDAVESKEGT